MNSSIATWFTPASLFLLLNLVIGTIFLISRFGGQRTQKHYQDLHHHHQPVESDYPHPYPNPEISDPLARAPSLLERVRSISFQPLYRSDSTSYEEEPHQPVESEHTHTYPSSDTSTPVARQPSLLGKLKSINLQSLYNPDSTRYEKESHQPVESKYSHPYPSPDTTTPLARAPSLLERLKYIQFQSLLNRSDSNSSNNDHHPPTADKMKKSASEKTAEDTSSEAEVGKTVRSLSSTSRTEKRGSDRTSALDDEVCVNTKADDFIKRFKQQLRLQRLDSLLGCINSKAI